MSDSNPNSILSHGERVVAELLADGLSTEEIAATRDVSHEEVEKSIDRIYEKTERALVTLAESPFTTEVGVKNEETRANVVKAFDDDSEEALPSERICNCNTDRDGSSQADLSRDSIAGTEKHTILAPSSQYVLACIPEPIYEIYDRRRGRRRGTHLSGCAFCG
ncbi:helix-turn-helix transcriptional regulator [Halocatena marina]|uniref:helix-turn-helix transcriptional regulator n=1 Tax=Halocatena marina TaxID=2934937 RepID=UPI0036157121